MDISLYLNPNVYPELNSALEGLTPEEAGNRLLVLATLSVYSTPKPSVIKGVEPAKPSVFEGEIKEEKKDRNERNMDLAKFADDFEGDDL